MKYEMDIIDEASNKVKRLWIEDGKVRYSEVTSEHSGMYLLHTEQFSVTPGNVTLDSSISDAIRAGTGISYVKRLLLFGFTSFIHVVEIDNERTFLHTINKSRKVLKDCPLDHIHAVRLPLSKLTDSLIRKIKLEAIPIIFFQTESLQELEAVPWKRITEAMFPKRILLVCEPNQSTKEIVQNAWEQIVLDNKINSFFNFPSEGNAISPLLCKRIGLFPKKGSLIMGSDADYLMYGTFPREEQPIKLPDIIVLKGEVVKAGKRWMLDNVKGEEMTSLVPEQFLPIQDINRYED